jgi:ABC-type glycerol-3-phosphate transport system permease component
VYIAGLQAIDRSLYAAARVDGATRWQLLRHVKLPLLKPTIKLSVFFAILGSFQLFDLVMPMTRGGPSDSTQTMVSFLYNHGITRMRVGLRQRDRRGAVRHLRGLRHRLQARRICATETAMREAHRASADDGLDDDPFRGSLLPRYWCCCWWPAWCWCRSPPPCSAASRILGELRTNPFGLRTRGTSENYWGILSHGRYWQMIFNSAGIATFTTALVLVGRRGCGVRFAHLRFAARTAICSTTFLIGLLFPAATAILPLFIQGARPRPARHLRRRRAAGGGVLAGCGDPAVPQLLQTAARRAARLGADRRRDLPAVLRARGAAAVAADPGHGGRDQLRAGVGTTTCCR